LNISNRNFSGKILLFGEYSIIEGGSALAIPLLPYSGKWTKSKTSIMDLPFSMKDLLKYLQKFASFIYTEDIEKAFSEGLHFESDIPIGYGVGSSGAFSAALYDLFAKAKSVEIEDIKFQLAAIESFFHGSSSGLDPLVSYLNKKIHVDETFISIVDWDAPLLPAGFFLLDTKVPRKTEPLVKLYQEKTREIIYKKRIESSLIPLVEEAILMYANQLGSKLFETMHELSNFQFRYFDQMIPVEVRSLWLDGLVGNDYKLKLCGAGGGGFILGYTLDMNTIKQKFSGYQIIPI